MQPRNTLFTALLAMAAASACGDGTPTAGPAEAPLAVSAQQVSQGMALALADGALREQLRDAMRASPYTEHKLLLAEYLATPQGAALSAAAARALGVREAEFAAAAGRLPSMDFYVPAREDRLSWQGGENVAVFVVTGRGGVVTGYTPAGATVQAQRSLAGTEQVEIVMHPAESRSYRLDRQPDLRGRVIQDANDGEIGIVRARFDAFGNVIEHIDFGRKQELPSGVRLATYEENTQYCAYPGYDLDTGCRLKDTYMPGFAVQAEDGDGVWGSLEMRFKTYFSTGKPYNTTTVEDPIWIVNGVPPYQWVDLRTRYNARLGLYILDNTPSVGGCQPFGGPCSGDEVSVSVREDDGSFGQDRYGNALFYANESGELRYTSSGVASVQVTWFSTFNRYN
ncbi:MAG TPA: hypothetical protein VHG93_24985 [Longimicrobium sp.]|nr:hypothetical protein [Longimicrobium sp.]